VPPLALVVSTTDEPTVTVPTEETNEVIVGSTSTSTVAFPVLGTPPESLRTTTTGNAPVAFGVHTNADTFAETHPGGSVV